MDLSGWKMVIGGSAFTVGLATPSSGAGDGRVYRLACPTCPILTLAQLKARRPGPAARRQTVPNRCRTGLPIPLNEPAHRRR